MSVWPVQSLLLPSDSNLGTHSLSSLGSYQPTFASGTWPVSNRAIYVPFRCPALVVARLWWLNGPTVSGSADLGIFDPSGVKLCSTGSVAQASGNTIQSTDITDYQLDAGLYYFGLALNNTTGTIFRYSLGSAFMLPFVGIAEQAGANVPLPAVATFATATGTAIPLCGLALGTVL